MTALSELAVPGPTMTALTTPFWAAVEEGRLLIQRCGGCGRAVFYPRAMCPYCWSEDVSWEEASGRGRLKSFSEVWKPGHPGWIPGAPYVVGLVALAEGPVMLSNVLPGGRAVVVGDAVMFGPTNIGGRVLPCFRVEKGG